jgi:hypothetical protein
LHIRVWRVGPFPWIEAGHVAADKALLDVEAAWQQNSGHSRNRNDQWSGARGISGWACSEQIGGTSVNFYSSQASLERTPWSALIAAKQ